jgi:pimeloyl-ACP methyl ester carboxylesterase
LEKQTVIWIVPGIIALLVIEFLIRLPIILGVVQIFEQSAGFGVEPAEPRDDCEQISFLSTDGLTIRGSIFSPTTASRGVVIFCPETGGNHWMALEYTVALREAGFTVVGFDFRNQGDSDDMKDYNTLHWPTAFEVSDALATIDYVTTRDDLMSQPIAMFGVSRGGAVALVAAARRAEVRCVVCDGAFMISRLMQFFARRWAELYVPRRWLQYIPDWHIATTLWFARQISQFKRGVRYATLGRDLPKLRNKGVLLIAGQRDNYVKPEITKEIARRVGGNAQIWIAPKAKHNCARSENKEEYDRRIVEFVEQHLVSAGD